MLYSNRSHDPFGLVLGSFCCSRQEHYRIDVQYFEAIFPWGDTARQRSFGRQGSYLVDNENFHALFQPIARSVRAGSRFILVLSSRALQNPCPDILEHFFIWGETARRRSFGRQGSYLVNNENFHALFQPIARSVRAGSRVHFVALVKSIQKSMSRFLEQFFHMGETARRRSFGRQGATWLITRTSMLYSNRSHDPFGLVLGFILLLSRQEHSESMSRFLDQFFHGEKQHGKDPLADKAATWLITRTSMLYIQPIARSVRAGSRVHFVALVKSIQNPCPDFWSNFSMGRNSTAKILWPTGSYLVDNENFHALFQPIA